MPRPTLDFDRNDLPAALSAWDANAASDDPDPDLTEALVLMFDDPGPFLKALDKRTRKTAPRRPRTR